MSKRLAGQDSREKSTRKGSTEHKNMKTRARRNTRKRESQGEQSKTDQQTRTTIAKQREGTIGRKT